MIHLFCLVSLYASFVLTGTVMEMPGADCLHRHMRIIHLSSAEIITCSEKSRAPSHHHRHHKSEFNLFNSLPKYTPVITEVRKTTRSDRLELRPQSTEEYTQEKEEGSAWLPGYAHIVGLNAYSTRSKLRQLSFFFFCQQRPVCQKLGLGKG